MSRLIRNYSLWTDTDGRAISCHEGGVLRSGGTFYWYGTCYKKNPNGFIGRKGAPLLSGLNCYSSGNLVDWRYEGCCLEVPKEGWLPEGTWHRPRVLYDSKSRRYVMWFFCLGSVPPGYPPLPDKGAMGNFVVAVATDPQGPFEIIGPRRLGDDYGWSGDLALFQDHDGRGYIAYDDGWRSIRVDLLRDDFLNTTGQSTIALKRDDAHRYEGASMIRYKGKYLVAGSGVKGLDPTETICAVADAPLGPYRYLGQISRDQTWNSQISAFVHIAESDTLLAICEQWFRGPDGQRVPVDESCQLWLPVSFDPASEEIDMRHVRQWDPFTATEQGDF